MGKGSLDSPEIDTKQPAEVFDTIFVEEQEIETVPGISPGLKGKGGLDPYLQELAFNEEMVEVMVHESTNDNDENPVFTACNGVSQYFFRGIPQLVKRKYVAILASCKEHRVTTPSYVSDDGTRGMSVKRTSFLKYPFSIIHDANPRGPEWLKALLRSPT